MVRRLSTVDAAYEAAKGLDELGLNPSEFGYRMQAMLAETLAVMGGGIDAVERVGHPDILVRMGGKTLRIQSKATGQRRFTLSKEDLDGIRPRTGDEEGYLAILDRGPPVAWTCVRYAKAQSILNRNVPLAMLKTMDDAYFSSQCTAAFLDLVNANRSSLEAFTFALLSKRAIASGHGDIGGDDHLRGSGN